MARIEVTRRLDHPHTEVWAALADLASHTEWMRDARSIVFTSASRHGIGTRMEVETVVGPFRTKDVMEVVGWEEGRSIEVVHSGLVTGRGTLSATPTGKATEVSWVEELSFPWWLGDGVTAWLARPVLAAIWRGNLRRLEESVSSH